MSEEMLASCFRLFGATLGFAGTIAVLYLVWRILDDV